MALGEAIARGRQAIPPPGGMQGAVPAWQRLAERLGGQLVLATMRIDGVYAGVPAAVRTVWTTERVPRFTRVELAPGLPLRGADATMLAELSRGALGASVGPDTLFVDLPAPLLDTDEAVERLAALARVFHILRAQGGAYR